MIIHSITWDTVEISVEGREKIIYKDCSISFYPSNRIVGGIGKSSVSVYNSKTGEGFFLGDAKIQYLNSFGLELTGLAAYDKLYPAKLKAKF